MLRTIVCCTTLILALSLNAAAAPACDDAECQAVTKSKPLDITKFMREQAAGTRGAEPRQRPVQQRKVHPVAHVQRPAHRAVAARPKPAELPAEAATSYASQQPAVQVVASDEFNDIDRAAAAAAQAPAETTGAAVAAESNVQLVGTDEFNDIDRKAEDRWPPPATAGVADAHDSVGQPSVSWLQWIWSAVGAVGNVFTALATAVHQLLRL